MSSGEYELHLISSWCSGINHEDLSSFDAADFEIHAEIFAALKKNAGSSDLVEIARDAGMRVSDLAQILSAGIPSLYPVSFQKIKECRIQRLIREAASGDFDIDNLMKRLNSEHETLSRTTLKPPTNLCDAYRAEIERRATEDPVSWGLPRLDFLTGGLHRGELSVLAARPGVGKTAFALNVALSTALKKRHVIFFPLEMSGAQLADRIACAQSNLSPNLLRHPERMTIEHRQDLEDFLKAYESTVRTLDIVEGVSTIQGIQQHIRQAEPDLVIIDQLSQLRDPRFRFGSIRERFVHATNSLKELCMTYDVPLLLLAQINRSGQDREPTLADIKESGSTEEDSDNIFLLHQTGELGLHDRAVDLLIAKQRNGPAGSKIPLHYEGTKFKFKEVRG